MIRRLGFLRYFIPTWVDAWILATAVLWCVAAVASILDHANFYQFDPIDTKLPIATGGSAIILALSMRQCFQRVSLLVVGMFGATTVGVFLILKYVGHWADVELPHDIYASSKPLKPELILREYSLAYLPLIASTMIGAVAFWIGAYAIDRFPDSIRWPGKLAGAVVENRKRLMIGFCAVMLPFVILRNLFDPNNHSMKYILGFGMLLGILIAVVLAVPVLAGAVKRSRTTIRSVLLLAILIVVATVVFDNQKPSGDAQLHQMYLFVASLTAPLLFVLGLCAFWCRAMTNPAKRRWLSVWTPLILVVCIGSASALWKRYDMRVVASEFAFSRKTFFAGSWIPNAVTSREIRNTSGGAAGLISRNAAATLHVNIRGPQDKDCFASLVQKHVIPRGVGIYGLRPFVDIKPLASSFEGWVGVDGEISADQLSMLVTSCKGVGLQDSTLPVTNPSDLNLKTLMIGGGNPPENLTAFLDAYVPTGLKHLTIQTTIHDKDWDAIVRHQKQCKFDFLFVEPPQRILELSKRQSLSGIQIRAIPFPNGPSGLRQVIQSSINFHNFYADDWRSSWDLIFARPHSNSAALRWMKPDPMLTFQDWAQQSHWVFGIDQRDMITHIWLPEIQYVKQNPKQFVGVTTLRLDRDLLFIRNQVTNQTDLSDLKVLPNLERLYLGRGQTLGHLKFLRALPKLKHLQIHAQVRSVMPGSGYSVCRSLESMRIYGTIDPITVGELSKLPTLKRIEIVDEDFAFQKDSESAKLRKQLPGVEVVITHPETATPDVSEKWEQHLKNVRKEVLERLEKQIAEETQATSN